MLLSESISRNKRWRLDRIRKGLCVACGKPKGDTVLQKCEACLSKKRKPPVDVHPWRNRSNK